MKEYIGSFEGYLRVYRPRTKEFKASDMILERNMGMPILQVECGAFNNSNPNETCLAILHSRKLILASIT